MIPLEKQMLRDRARNALRTLSAEEREARSRLIAESLRGLEGIPFGFAPMKGEPAWFSGWPGERLVALPRAGAGTLEFFVVTVAEVAGLARGPLGAPEPPDDKQRRVDVSEAGTVLVPGVAFDFAGRRLGRGGGFYDRLLADARLRARRVGVCFACQLVEQVPVEPHDQRVDALITEAGWNDAHDSASDRD